MILDFILLQAGTLRKVAYPVASRHASDDWFWGIILFLVACMGVYLIVRKGKEKGKKGDKNNE